VRRLYNELRASFDQQFGHLKGSKYENLNIGPGFDVDPEFTNADKVQTLGADVLWDLEEVPSPFEADRFKLVVASHVLEHVYKLMPLMDELWRITKTGGHLVIFVPYYASHAAIANPEHVRFFSEQSFMFFNKERDVKGPGQYDMGRKCNWIPDCTILEPHPEFLKIPHDELNRKIQHEWNIVRELCCVLRKEAM